jgi:flagellin
VVLGSTPNNVGVEFATSGDADAYLEATDATSGVKAQYSLDMTTAATAGDAGALSWSADAIQVSFGDAYTINVDPADAATIGDFAAAINAKTSDWTFSVDITDAGDGTLEYTLIADAVSEGEFGDIVFEAVDADGENVAEIFTATANGDTMTEDVAGEDPTDATDASGGENLYLELLSADTYSMTIDDVSLEFVYDGTSASRDSIATTIETALNAGSDDAWNVSNTNGRLHIINEDGNAISLADFASEGSGKAVVSTDAATAGDLGTSQLLDDTSYDTGATTVETNTGSATVVELSFSGDDFYAFKVSDGVRTAVIDPTEVTFDDADTADVDEFDYESMAAAIEYGLSRAGMDDITVEIVEGDTDAETVITLTEATGKEISISSFASDSTGSMLVGRGSDDTTGVTRYLDDGVGDSSTTVSNISIGTVTGAQDAIAIIDRALEDINSQRSDLGAISNRLDHTINNLGNIVVNTEASQSRIEDADFAVETSNLTKAQILSQAATAMLAQANASKQSVLSLLQG